MRFDRLHLFALLAIVFAAGVVAANFPAGGWYSDLAAPSWSPPRGALVVAWPVFYVLMGLAAWNSLDAVEPPVRTTSFLGWVAALALVVAWSWLLLGLNRPGWALAGLGLALAALGWVLLRLGARAGPGRLLFLPCLAWLAYLWAWNFQVWRLNGGSWQSLFG